MAVTARFVGNLGGVKVTSVILSPGNGSGWRTIRTISVPAGETWLISAASSATASTSLRVDGRDTAFRAGTLDVVITKTGPASVQVQINSSAGNPSVSLYWVPIT